MKLSATARPAYPARRLARLARHVCAWGLVLFGLTADAAFAQGTYFIGGPGPGNTPYSFDDLKADGVWPYNGFVLGNDGNLYGTTFYGGTKDHGAIVKVDRSASPVTVTTVWSFGLTTSDPVNPIGALVKGKDGNFYGTTFRGGTGKSYDRAGAGTIFKFDASTLTVTTLYSFSGGIDGANPWAGLILASGSGNDKFYGSTLYGGFEGSPTVAPAVDNALSGHTTSAYPVGATINEIYSYSVQASASDFTVETAPSPASTYVAIDGGGGLANAASLTIPMSNDPKFKWVHLWRQVDTGGYFLVASTANAPGTNWVVFDSFPATGETLPTPVENGTLFSLTCADSSCSSGSFATVYRFASGEGANPAGPLLQVGSNFFGTTVYGGNNDNGTIFRFDGTSTLTTLYRFSGGADGGNPYGGLLRTSDPNANFYGTTPHGGVIPLPGGTATAPSVALTVDNTVLTGPIDPLDPMGPRYPNVTYTYPAGATIDEVYTYSTASNDADFTNETAPSPNVTYTAKNSGLGDGSANAALLTIPMSSDPAVTWVRLWRQINGGGYAFVGTKRNLPLSSWDVTEGPSAATGTLFKFDGTTLTTLHAFSGGADGANPFATPIQAADGDLYGTNVAGASPYNAGTVFKCALAAARCDIGNGALTTIYTFQDFDGNGPNAGLLQTSDGTFWGMAQYGGLGPLDNGVVFQLKPKVISAVALTVSNTPFVYDGRPHGVTAASASAPGSPSLPVTVTYNGSLSLPVDAGAYDVVATFPGDTVNLASSKTATLTIIKAASTVAISNQTILYDGLTHDAVASASGGGGVSLPVTLTYTDALGATVPAPSGVGGYTVSAQFTGDANNLPSNIATATLTITKATPTITWATPASITYGTVLSGTQLNATASVAGTLTYTPAAGTTPAVGPQTLSVTFTPTDTANYNTATTSVTITVTQLATTVTWATPAGITYGTPLSGTQLNAAATASLAGAFVYSPPAGTVVNAGVQTLSVTFTPTDTNYAAATTAVQLTVSKATPVLSWATPAPITYGTVVNAVQLNATTTPATGTFTYSTASGTLLNAGTYNLSVIFTPDTANYTTATAAVTLTIAKATPTLAWFPQTMASAGPLGVAQLNATASVPGRLDYTPPLGTFVSVGVQTLSVTFTPTDTANYVSGVTQTAQVAVTQLISTVTWATPDGIPYGTPLSSTQLNATANVPGTFRYTPAAGTILSAGPQILAVNFDPTDAPTIAGATAIVTLIVGKATPTITWGTPAAITYGTALSAAQLNATASVPGAFAYSPDVNTVLAAGARSLSVTFTPTDTANYTSATKTVSLTVNPVAPTITWAAPAAITYGAALSATQLNATASVAGTLTYTPAAGAVLSGGAQTLSVTFAPTDTINYSSVTQTVTLTVNKATPAIAWVAPSAITYGTALSTAQLNATSVVTGTFTYSPALTTVLSAGTQDLSVTFTPANTTNYTTAAAAVQLLVNKATPTIAWNPPAFMTVGTALSATQLNATATAAGTFVYTPPAGTVLPLGPATLSVAFTPADTRNYNGATKSVSLTVKSAQTTPTITWNAPAAITYGTPLSTTQLNATANVGGTFSYSPGLGTVLAVGAQTLTVTFTPTDTTRYTTATASVMLVVLSRPPTVANDSASTLEGVAVTIPVLANDTDPAGSPLSIASITQPAHGTAQITGTTVKYTPAANFFGADTFTYTASNLSGGKATATVSVSVSRLGRFVVLSNEFTWLRAGATVVTGDIGANNRRQHAHGHGRDFDGIDGDDITVRVGVLATMQQASSRVVGDTVSLEPRSSIYGLVDNGVINHGGTILGTRVDTMQTPFVALPAFPAVSAGTQNVTVAKNKTQTLAAGRYGKVRVNSGATLTLSGGLYQFTSLDVDQSATVIFAAAVEVRIATELDADSNSKLITGSGVRASQVKIYVAGDDDHCNNRHDDSFDGDDGGGAVVNIGENAIVQANIYAQNGSVWLKSKTQATGAFIGQHVRVGVMSKLTLDSAF